MKILIKFLSRKLSLVARRRVGQYKAGEEIDPRNGLGMMSNDDDVLPTRPYRLALPRIFFFLIYCFCKKDTHRPRNSYYVKRCPAALQGSASCGMYALLPIMKN